MTSKSVHARELVTCANQALRGVFQGVLDLWANIEIRRMQEKVLHYSDSQAFPSHLFNEVHLTDFEEIPVLFVCWSSLEYYLKAFR